MPEWPAKVGGSGDSGGGALCHLCQENVPNGVGDKRFQGYLFHIDPCWNALRAARRQWMQDFELGEERDELMKDDPAAWRKEVIPFMKDRKTAVADAGKLVQQYSRKRLLAQVESEALSGKTELVTEEEYVTERQRRNKFISDDAASLEFHEQLRDQGNQNPSGGCPAMIMYEHKKKWKTQHGHERRRELAHVEDMDATSWKEASVQMQAALGAESPAMGPSSSKPQCRAARAMWERETKDISRKSKP